MLQSASLLLPAAGCSQQNAPWLFFCSSGGHVLLRHSRRGAAVQRQEHWGGWCLDTHVAHAHVMKRMVLSLWLAFGMPLHAACQRQPVMYACSEMCVLSWLSNTSSDDYSFGFAMQAQGSCTSPYGFFLHCMLFAFLVDICCSWQWFWWTVALASSCQCPGSINHIRKQNTASSGLCSQHSYSK